MTTSPPPGAASEVRTSDGSRIADRGPMSASVGVGVVVRDADGRLLLGLRNKSDEPPTWCLPGGMVDPASPSRTPPCENSPRRPGYERRPSTSWGWASPRAAQQPSPQPRSRTGSTAGSRCSSRASSSRCTGSRQRPTRAAVSRDAARARHHRRPSRSQCGGLVLPEAEMIRA